MSGKAVELELRILCGLFCHSQFLFSSWMKIMDWWMTHNNKYQENICLIIWIHKKYNFTRKNQMHRFAKFYQIYQILENLCNIPWLWKLSQTHFLTLLLLFYFLREFSPSKVLKPCMYYWTHWEIDWRKRDLFSKRKRQNMQNIN